MNVTEQFSIYTLFKYLYFILKLSVRFEFSLLSKFKFNGYRNVWFGAIKVLAMFLKGFLLKKVLIILSYSILSIVPPLLPKFFNTR